MEFSRIIRKKNIVIIPPSIVVAYDINVGDIVTLDILKVTKK